MENNKIITGNCWVAYFDILGFKNKVSDAVSGSTGIDLETFVQVYYWDIIDKLKAKQEYWPCKVGIYWASDTFVFYTYDGSLESFTCISQEAEHFFIETLDIMPMRGALGVGELYIDKKNNIFVGPGYMDAYKYAEKQDWIGMVLTPNATAYLNKLEGCTGVEEYPVSFQEYQVPLKRIKKDIDYHLSAKKLSAFRIGRIPNVENAVRQKLKEAEINNCDKDVLRKYVNTLKFIEETKFKITDIAACS